MAFFWLHVSTIIYLPIYILIATKRIRSFDTRKNTYLVFRKRNYIITFAGWYCI